MKKLLKIIGILAVIAIIYSFIDNTPINTTTKDPMPTPTITDEKVANVSNTDDSRPGISFSDSSTRTRWQCSAKTTEPGSGS